MRKASTDRLPPSRSYSNVVVAFAAPSNANRAIMRNGDRPQSSRRFFETCVTREAHFGTQGGIFDRTTARRFELA